ncbi:MAG: SusE domain-containing protein, partial [Proteiniphilum sp.]|nr:SusE domain-containing protein [Proteiniphilum sp.]
MKLYHFIFLCVFGGLFLSSCGKEENETPQDETAKISLSAPDNNANITVTGTNDVTFDWNKTGTVSGNCLLVLSLSERLSSPQTIEIAGNPPLIVPARTILDKIIALGIEEGIPTKVYWSIKPASSDQNVETEIRTLNVTCSFPTLALNSPDNLIVIDGNNASSFPYTFSFTPLPSVSDYKIKFSLNEAFPTDATAVYDINTNSYSLTEESFNTLMADLGVTNSITTLVYWTVVAADETLVARSQVRSFSGRRSVYLNAVGSWSFDDPNNFVKADIGADLILGGTGFTSVAAPGTTNKGICIPDGIENYIHAIHNIQPNGGSTKDRVNEYTILLDFRVPNVTQFHSLIYTDVHLTRTGPSRLAVSDNWGEGKGGLTYAGWPGMSSDNVISPNVWYRVVLSAKCGQFWRVYLDGQLSFNGNVTDYAQRDSEFALETDGVLFATAGGWPFGYQMDISHI